MPWKCAIHAPYVLAFAAALFPKPAAGVALEPARTLNTIPAPIIQWEYDQIHPRVAFSPLSQLFLVVWEDHHWGFGTDWDIYARLVDLDGQPVGSAFAVSWEGSSARMRPAVAYNATGDEFLVVWEYEYSPGDHDIFGRVVSSSGALLGPEIPIETATDFESSPAVIWRAAGNQYLVAYEDRVGAAPQQHAISLRVTDQEGTPITSRATLTGAGDMAAPDVGYSHASDRYLLVWDEIAGPNRAIYGYLLEDDGSVDSGLLQFGPPPGVNRSPRLAYDGLEDRFFAVWHTASGNDHNVHGRVYDLQSGLGMLQGIVNSSGHDDDAPAITMLPEWRFYFLPYQYEYSSTDFDVRAVWRGPDTRLLYEAQFMPVSTGAANEENPATASDGHLGALVVWEDDRDAGTSGTDLWCRMMRIGILTGAVSLGEPPSVGHPLGNVAVSIKGSASPIAPEDDLDLVFTGPDGRYVLPFMGQHDYYWIIEEDPVGFRTVAASCPTGVVVSLNTLRMETPVTGLIHDDNNFWNLQNVSVKPEDRVDGPMWVSAPFPNPSHGDVALDVRGGRGAHVELEVLDVRGRLVRRMQTEAGAGVAIRWDGRFENGSTAPAGLYHLRVRRGGETIVRRLAIVR